MAIKKVTKKEEEKVPYAVVLALTHGALFLKHDHHIVSVLNVTPVEAEALEAAAHEAVSIARKRLKTDCRVVCVEPVSEGVMSFTVEDVRKKFQKEGKK